MYTVEYYKTKREKPSIKELNYSSDSKRTYLSSIMDLYTRNIIAYKIQLQDGQHTCYGYIK